MNKTLPNIYKANEKQSERERESKKKSRRREDNNVQSFIALEAMSVFVYSILE